MLNSLVFPWRMITLKRSVWIQADQRELAFFYEHCSLVPFQIWSLNISLAYGKNWWATVDVAFRHCHNSINVLNHKFSVHYK